MLGEAGIGYFYLRLFFDSTPSILLPTCESNINSMKAKQNGYKEIQEKYIGEFFGETIKLLKETDSGIYDKLLELPLRIGENISDVTISYEKLKEFLNNEHLTKNHKLINQFVLDRKRYLKTLGILDFTKEYIKEIARKNIAEFIWDKERFIIGQATRLIIFNF